MSQAFRNAPTSLPICLSRPSIGTRIVSKLTATVKAQPENAFEFKLTKWHFTCVWLGRCDRWNGAGHGSRRGNALTDPVLKHAFTPAAWPIDAEVAQSGSGGYEG